MPINDFNDLPLRRNGQRITYDWFNDIREAGVNSEGSGSGVGGVNYIENFDIETDATGYTGYGNAVNGVAPDTFAGAASANFAASRNTTNPLRGDGDLLIAKTGGADLRGKGVYYQLRRNTSDLFIEDADLARVMRVSFDYDATDSNYTDGMVRVYIVASNDDFISDFTTIELTQRDLPAGSGRFMSEFQTLSDKKYYRLCFHQASTTTANYNLYFDFITSGPREIARGPVGTDPVSYTPSFTNFSLGNGTQSFKWARNKEYMEIEGYIQFGSTSSITSTIAFSLPSGFNLDVSNMTRSSFNRVGVASCFDQAGTGEREVYAITQNSASLSTFVVAGRTDAGAQGNWNTTFPFTWGTNDEMYFSVKVPILGWSSNQNQSSDFGGRILAARLHSSSTSIGTGGTKIVFNTVEYDTAGQISSSTFTAQETGFYDVDWRVETQTVTLATNERFLTQIFKNGSFYAGGDRILGNGAAGVIYISVGCTQVYLTKGETLELNAVSSQTVSATNGTTCHFSVAKRSSPQTLLGGEIETAYAVKNTGAHTLSGNWQEVAAYTSVIFNDFGAFNGTTGRYTFSKSGRFLVAGTVGFAANATGIRGVAVYKNGNQHEIGNFLVTGTTGFATILKAVSIVNVVAGDYVSLFASQDSGGNLNYDTASARSTNISVMRIN
jgi:hypothetical protein